MQITKLFKLIIRALKSEHHDYTLEPIRAAIVLLAVPMILELSLESIFAVVDMYFVSQLGSSAIATVGLTEAVVTLIYSVGIGLSTGVTAIVSRRIGEKNSEGAAQAASQALLVAALIAILLGIVGVIFASDILKLMGATDEVVSLGTSFAQIMLGGNAVILFLFLLNGVFRGAGDAAMAMRSLWIASGTNIILCPILIHIFGLKGAAIATLIGRGCGVAYQAVYLARGLGEFKIRSEYFAINPNLIKSILNIAAPATFQFLIGSGSWIYLTRLVAETGGTDASAGYQIAFRNFVFFILPAWGLSNAAATLVGQNIGAQKIKRAEECVYSTLKISAALMSVVTLIFVGFAPWLVEFFTSSPAVASHATKAMQIFGSGFVFYGIGMVLTQALNGSGDTKAPTRINILSFWVFQTPIAYILALHSPLKSAGAMVAIPISHALLCFLAWLAFKKGNWKAIKI